MSATSLNAIQNSLQGELIGDDVEITSVSTDSRNIAKGSLFVALKGAQFDGHQFLVQAENNGAKAALVEEPANISISQLKVDDTLVALGQVANFNRQQFQKPLLALTGSAGKTTTKEMLSVILAEAGDVLATRGNFNNEIGVPLTLLELDAKHQFAVIEMGAAKKGDIAYLMGIAAPDISLITNAMPAHIEGFGSLDNVASSKGEIFSELKASGIAIVNLDDQYAQLWLDTIGEREVVGFSMQGNPQAKVSATVVSNSEWSSCISLQIENQQLEINLPVPGTHNIANALAAAAGAHALNVELDTIARGLEKFTSVAGRLQLVDGVRGSRIIDDSYNANPGSVKSAVDVLAGFDSSTWLVLGDMAELGEESELLHQQVAEYALEKNIDKLLCVGEKSAITAKSFGAQGFHFSLQQQLIDYCKQHLRGGEVLLVKGSRSSRMENIVNGLMQSEGES